MSDVIIGVDDWLFLSGGSNQPLRLYQEPDFFSDAMEREWTILLLERAAACERLGIRYRHLIAPDKITVFPERTGVALRCPDRAPLARLGGPQSIVRGVLCDGPATVAGLHGTEHSFYRTDSHWTVHGAAVAYRAACTALGVKPGAFLDDPSRKWASWPVAFDLGQKMSPAVTEEVVFTPLNDWIERAHTNEIVRIRDESGLPEGASLPHHGSHVILRNPRAPVNETIVLFGDSFLDYRPSTLTALFAETFAETHFLWSTSMDFDYIRSVRPRYVLSEIAERFMTLVPSDEGFSFTAYVEAALARWRSKATG